MARPRRRPPLQTLVTRCPAPAGPRAAPDPAHASSRALWPLRHDPYGPAPCRPSLRTLVSRSPLRLGPGPHPTRFRPDADHPHGPAPGPAGSRSPARPHAFRPAPWDAASGTSASLHPVTPLRTRPRLSRDLPRRPRAHTADDISDSGCANPGTNRWRPEYLDRHHFLARAPGANVNATRQRVSYATRPLFAYAQTAPGAYILSGTTKSNATHGCHSTTPMQPSSRSTS